MQHSPENGIWTRRALTATPLDAGGVAISFSSGRIASIEPCPRPPAGFLDAGDGIVTPGLVDIQVNGALAHGFQSHDRAHFDEIVDFHLRSGTTCMLPTLVTAHDDILCESLRVLAAYCAEQPAAALPGIHLEGPFLAPAKSGAHDPDALRLPDPALAARFLASAVHDGRSFLRMTTVAPELPGAQDLIAQFTRAAVVVAAGHSAARFADVQAGVRAGLRTITHAGNASDWPHRELNDLGFMGSEPGLVGALLAIPELAGSVIMDGFHFHPALLQPLLALKGPTHFFLTSDASSVAGCPPGDYEGGGLAARVDPRGFALSLRGGQWLAGSTITLADAVRRAVQLAGLSFNAAIYAASAAPAALIGLAGRKGSLQPGADADLLVWDDDMRVRVVLRGATAAPPPQHPDTNARAHKCAESTPDNPA
jgi:N-acetylglucosamine-6-phosphate deacetylase